MLLDMHPCGNPECRFVHIKGFVVDERCEDLKFDGCRFTFKVKEGSNLADHPVPKQSFEASVSIDSYEVELHMPQELANSDLMDWLAMELKQNLSEIIQRRWRIGTSIKRDDWKKKDWSWWERNVMIAWDEIYPDDADLFVSVSGKHYWAADSYCVNPQCACKDIMLSFIDTSKKTPQDLGAVAVDLKTFRHGEIHSLACDSKVLKNLWDRFKVEPDIRNILIKRQKEMKKIGRELIKLKTVTDSRIDSRTDSRKENPW